MYLSWHSFDLKEIYEWSIIVKNNSVFILGVEMKTTLLIMAAGIGSRFGGGIKQLEAVGVNDEIIMDYSIHDAIAAGFNKIIFVIRIDIEADFKERIGDRISSMCEEHGIELCYAFQDLNDIPAGYSVPEGRTKPWGTGSAIKCAKEYLPEPFMVINADDYYGKTGYKLMHEWLVQPHEDNAISMVGFVIKNTLSDNGGVTRGICKVEDGHTHVVDVVETKNIVKCEGGASANGEFIPADTYVSMNMWGFPAVEGQCPPFVTLLDDGFVDFFEKSLPADPMKAEYLLPALIGGFLKAGTHTVKLLETDDKWFGVTYAEDKPAVVKSIRELIDAGVYKADLYSDLW